MQSALPKKTFEAFTGRLNEVCTDMGLPEHGRQSQLARLLGVTHGDVAALGGSIRPPNNNSLCLLGIVHAQGESSSDSHHDRAPARLTTPSSATAPA